jgi:hypothetical protein
MRLDDLFTICNGVASTGLSIEPNKQAFHLPYLRPSSTQEGTIAGWVWLRDIDERDIYSSETLFVSTNGEGSHSYAYVSSFDFVANSDVSVLIPKHEMSLLEKIYYAQCITMNRWKFSYGRKPKGKRLASIELPDAMPQKFLNIDSEPYFEWSKKLDSLFDIPNKHAIPAADGTTKLVPIKELFDIKYGINMELYKFDICPPSHDHAIPFVARSEKNNGITAYVEKRVGYKPNPAHTLSLAGGGSVLSTFYQSKPYYSGRDLYYLIPKRTMNVIEMLFYAMVISANKYRYSYGRQANKTFKNILIPISMPEAFNISYPI